MHATSRICAILHPCLAHLGKCIRDCSVHVSLLVVSDHVLRRGVMEPEVCCFFATGVLRPLARGRPLCVVLSGTLLLQRRFLFENTVVVAFVLLALVNHF